MNTYAFVHSPRRINQDKRDQMAHPNEDLLRVGFAAFDGGDARHGRVRTGPRTSASTSPAVTRSPGTTRASSRCCGFTPG